MRIRYSLWRNDGDTRDRTRQGHGNPLSRAERHLLLRGDLPDCIAGGRTATPFAGRGGRRRPCALHENGRRPVLRVEARTLRESPGSPHPGVAAGSLLSKRTGVEPLLRLFRVEHGAVQLRLGLRRTLRLLSRGNPEQRDILVPRGAEGPLRRTKPPEGAPSGFSCPSSTKTVFQ